MALEKNKKMWNELLMLFQNATAKEIDILFHLFLTMAERDMILDRYEITKALLTTELTQREISEKFHTSISKVTAGSKAVQVLKDKEREFLLEKMGE